MKKVVPGQRFSIGANDWNQIADVVNHRNIGEQTGRGSKPAGWVMAAVSGSYLAYKHSAYAVTGALEAWNTSALTSANVETESDIASPVLKVNVTKPASASVVYPEFVVMQENTPVNECGWAIVSGVTPALVQIRMAQHNYCYYSGDTMLGTNRTVLYSSFEGNAKIIWRPDTITANGIYWCLIEIGSVSGDEYLGYFKALIDNDKIVICDGARPSASTAGIITNPKLFVAKTEFSIVTGKIFLEVIYNDSTKTYSASFYQGTSIYGSPNYGNPLMWYTEIAEYTSAGQLIQHHTTGLIEITGRWL